MIKNERYVLLVAESTHLIIRTEALLKEKNIICKIIPLPGELKASCGLSVKVQLEDKDKVINELNREKIQVEIYLVEKKGLKKQYEKVL